MILFFLKTLNSLQYNVLYIEKTVTKRIDIIEDVHEILQNENKITWDISLYPIQKMDVST